MTVLLPGCEDETPTAPPPPPPPEAQPPDVPVDQGQVTIYDLPNFEGQGYTLRGSIANLRDLPGPCGAELGTGVDGNWDDCISSIRVSPGWEAVLVDRPNFPPDDDFLPLNGTDVADLGDIRLPDGVGDWDNRVSSIAVKFVGSPAAENGQR